MSEHSGGVFVREGLVGTASAYVIPRWLSYILHLRTHRVAIITTHLTKPVHL